MKSNPIPVPVLFSRFSAFFLSLLFLFPTSSDAQKDPSPPRAKGAVEICNNGIDDDGDGLIDCYDQDCTCAPGTCDNFYYTTCNADCFFQPPCDKIQLGVQWISEAETGTYSPLVAGDMDRDGIPEVVVIRSFAPDPGDIYILSGTDGKIKVHIQGETTYPGGTAPAIADLDKDGYGELVVVGQDRLLRCYEHDGTLKYRSPNPVGYNPGYNHSVPNIADFDYNGWPEINIGNQIYNGQTGVLLAQGNATMSAGEHPARVAQVRSWACPVPVDVLPDNACPDCQGLEIVAGNSVLSVNLQTGVVMTVVKCPNAYSDGFTSVADIDRDGDLDAIVQGKKNGRNTVYCWEIESPAILREFQLPNNYAEGASRVNVADLNGDGKLEISFVAHPKLFALKNDFTVLWSRDIIDFSSITSSSIFDFCGDGSADVIYRGEQSLQVIEGATGIVKWEDVCVSATHIENPLVLDVDGDGQTEILIQCGTNGSTNFGKVVAYQAVGTPGIASRRVWNQHAFFNVNINDDLSVPVRQQNPHIVGDSLKLNGFLNQYFNPTFPAPDVVLTFQSVRCDRDSFVVTLTARNTGDNTVPAVTPVTAYKGNPQRLAAPWVHSIPLGFALAPDSVRSFTYRMPRTPNDTVFIIFNDNHSITTPFKLNKDFPSTTLGECSFTNNIVSFLYNYQPPVLNLGRDTAICHNGTLTLNATGANYVSFQWQNGVTTAQFTAPGPGVYAATVTDVCGLTQTDQIRVTIDSATVAQIGPDRTICQGETVALSETGFDTYSWSPVNAVSCANCATVQAGPSRTGRVILTAGLKNGCTSRDTVFITVRDTFYVRIDTTICYGRTVRWNGVDIAPDSSRVFALQTRNGCDSTVQVRVKGTTTGTYQMKVDTGVCLGSTLSYNGELFKPGDSRVFFLSARTGCDSTVTLKVLPLDTFYTQEKRTICAGDTSFIFGDPQRTTGIYRKKFAARNGCDSTHLVHLTVLDPISVVLNMTPACVKEPTGAISAAINGSTPPFALRWSEPNLNGNPVRDLPAGRYALTVTDANRCTETAQTEVTEYPAIRFSLRADSVRCFGETNGRIAIRRTDTTLMFSLDDSNYRRDTLFKDLKSARYEVFAEDSYGCVDTQAVSVAQPPQLIVLLPADTTLILGESLPVRIRTTAVRPLQYVWADTSFIEGCTGCPRPVLRPVRSHTYALTVTDTRGCSATDVIAVAINRVIGVYQANALAPDSGKNGIFWPGFGPATRLIRRFAIFDRWGTNVYERSNVLPNDLSQGWDGRFNGRYAESGVYVWLLEVELWDGTTELLKGDVTVMR